MYIKSIVLDGFKSYGNRVEVSGFDRQFNAITGLNGTGKSNILDSICFLLGITNLSQVRAGSLQDLIYKSGQAGVNKATVSITFDNSDAAQSPPGFENYKELIVTRQIAMGGKNKYMINGTNVPNKRVQDLFCSVQLNVNNPHFLIMQGRVTKVLNMKPAEILAMVEEAAGTRMYETKRQITLKTLSKKEAKLEELTTLYTDELTPKLEKLKRERADYFEFQRAQKEMEFMMGLFQAYLFYDTQRAAATAEENLKEATGKVKAIEDTISTNTEKIEEIDGEITVISQELQNKAGGKLQTIEAELKTLEKSEAKAISAEKSAKESITSESKKLKQLEKDLNDDGKALEMKEKELENVKNVFQTLKDADEADSQAFNIAQKKFEAISAGMEVNDEGEAQTLQEQLMIAKQCATQANTEIKQATKELAYCQSQFKEKQKNLGANTADYERSKRQLESLEKEVQTLETALGHLNYSEQRNGELQERRRTLVAEVRAIRERIGQFEAQRPYTQFNYRDPETNFDRRSVKGVVCKLISLKERTSSTALETAAGGRLYNVVVSDDVTSKKLLQRGQLQNRTTFIPLNKIQGGQIPHHVIKLAQDLVGKENIKPALSLINYDRQLQPAMEYIFGNVFIAKDMTAARAVTFHDGIRRKCVTLQGDVTDPSGTLSGGAPQKGASVLLQLDEIRQLEAELREKEAELAAVESEIRKMSATREQFTESKRSFDRKSQELAVVRMKLQQTTHHQQQEEINALKTKIDELTTTLHTTRTTESHHTTKATAIQARILDSTTHRDRLLKSAEADMHSAKARSTRSKQNWERREQEYETLTLEITELRAALERLRANIAEAEATRLELEGQLREASDTVGVVGEQCAVLRAEVKKEKEATSARSRVLRGRVEVKEKLTGENAELVLEGKRQGLVVGKCQEEYRIAKSRETEAKSKRKENTDRDDKHMDDAREMSKKDAGELERRIKGAKDKVTKMGRTVNTKAQSMYDNEEKEYVKVVKKKRTVQEDKKSLLDVLADLDKKKKAALKLAFEQVSKDFGSIFGTLLPGSNAKLKIPEGMTILEGLEVKVSLGGVWKESLGELSGGQRSLVALSLILSMLLFKPAPLYILDEVDAALDLSHTQNIGNMLKSHFKQSQFIIVSLKDGMFNNANVLFRTKFIDGMSVVSKTVNKSR